VQGGLAVPLDLRNPNTKRELEKELFKIKRFIDELELAVEAVEGSVDGPPFPDGGALVHDVNDSSKRMRIDAGAIAQSGLRVISMPNHDVDLASTGGTFAAASHTHTESDITDLGNYINSTVIDAKGDLIVGTADNAASRLAVGTDDYSLVADSSATEGIAWSLRSVTRVTDTEPTSPQIGDGWFNITAV
jgi:hypothetical protein